MRCKPIADDDDIQLPENPNEWVALRIESVKSSILYKKREIRRMKQDADEYEAELGFLNEILSKLEK